MEPSLVLAGCLLLFAGSHVGLATGRVRGALVARLGPVGFDLVFSLVAAASFGLLVHAYAVLRLEGAEGPALGRFAVARALAIATLVAGFMLMGGGLQEYPRSPMSLFGADVREPRGLGRVTRHPFFVGMALFGAAHALLATRLVGSVVFGGLALFALLGAVHQDGKLLALRGEPYDAYLMATSLLPFAAIVGRRQRLVWRELPLLGLALGALAAWGLRAVHDGILDDGGARVIAVTLAGAAFATLSSWWRARRGLPTGPFGPLPH
jgi:uncharacterized membrane protein